MTPSRTLKIFQKRKNMHAKTQMFFIFPGSKILVVYNCCE